MQSSIPIPRTLWEALELTLSNTLRMVTKDVAKAVNKSPAPLTKALEGKINIHITDEPEETDSAVRCNYMCQHSDTPAFLRPCGEPIVWRQSSVPRCLAHLVSKPITMSTMKPIQYGSTVLAVADDGTVYSGEGEAMAFYDGERLTVFEVVDEGQ